MCNTFLWYFKKLKCIVLNHRNVLFCNARSRIGLVVNMKKHALYQFRVNRFGEVKHRKVPFRYAYYRFMENNGVLNYTKSKILMISERNLEMCVLLQYRKLLNSNILVIEQ